MKKILFHRVRHEKVASAYRQQAAYLRTVWHDGSFGIERLVRLFLCLSAFLFPLLLIREVAGRWGGIARRLAVEGYTVGKLLFPLAVLAFRWYVHPAVLWGTAYLLAETVLNVVSFVFLCDVIASPISYARSVLLLCLHYLEVVLDFAVFYIGLGVLSEPVGRITAVYFSIVANTTVGFGDIYARGPAGQLLVIVQLGIGVLFVVVLINYFSTKAHVAPSAHAPDAGAQ